MRRVSRHWFWLVLIAFLVTRLADVHLHFCLDGQEPASAVHLTNDAVHNDEHHAETDHSDRDVNVFDVVLVKKLADPTDALLLALVATLLLLLLPPRRERPLRRPTASPVLRSLLLLKPPLRGPPR
ncbi:hypothetical protein [Povalibacter sp.]|uniref:hypothetical protein n=1 Tax=Povalibacter sp. TaxID=1962978 RepID=UPI002F40B32E